MKKKLTLYNTIISVVVLTLMFGLGLLVTASNNRAQAEEKIIQIANIYAENYANGQSVSSPDENIRVTVIDSNGTVLSDSQVADVSEMENHSDRPEIIAAFSGSPAVETRFSETLGKEMMYYAVKADAGDGYIFVRISMPTTTISAYLIKTLPLMLLILFVCIILAGAVSVFTSDRILSPIALVRDNLRSINDGRFKEIKPTYKDDDLNSLLCEISDIGVMVQENIAKLKEERNKLNFVLNNINDCVFAVNENANLILINQKGKEIFGVNDNISGRNIDGLTENKLFSDSVKACLDGKKNAVFELELNENIFLVTVKILGSDWLEKSGGKIAVVVLSDITGAKSQEKIRSEFFENASHELKTPLTSIKGFNELLSMNNKDKSLDGYVAQIARETDRMLSLVEDMLKLSELENAKIVEKTEVDLAETAKNAADTLAPLINAKKIKFEITGAGVVSAEKKHIYELVKNLEENAVKYNNEGGNVTVEIKQSGGKVTLAVKDNGIGIEAKHLSRIFERFYRVDSSRSRVTGGTGLGLAIVKHICNLYNAEISVCSKLSVGTTVTVVFNDLK